ncbi:Asp-tRNA(Asn) amidotransferase subunit GatC [Candidatus Pacearchaeota archaeon]|nr:Asp-tRNA(Asn) amidotransferase subunit GatC [Candidatus Pacearchaeota archaeon]MBD3283549.1 Asp-tRNA(Asn) amidotransferase subunit GatC [Candidatus Pacearchaeota archaeon]
MNEKQIEKQAKNILDKFSKALGKVEELEDYYVDREKFERDENGEKCDKDFKERMLDNAPRKNRDFVIAEKGDWKK